MAVLTLGLFATMQKRNTERNVILTQVQFKEVLIKHQCFRSVNPFLPYLEMIYDDSHLGTIYSTEPFYLFVYS